MTAVSDRDAIREVALVPMLGARRVYGFRQDVMGNL